MNLANKTAIITGASSGLGHAVSTQVTAAGGTVFGLARSEAKLADVQKELGDAFRPISCDITERNQIEEAVQKISDSAGSIDVLVNNAGLAQFGPVDEVSDHAWNVQFETNVRGLFMMTRAVVPHMKRQNEQTGFGGHIINIASIAGLLGNPNISAYNATKFSVRGFSEAIMKELREDGIKVSCVYPGSIRTSFFEVADSSMTKNPMEPEDVASTILHLLQGPENYLVSEVVMRPLRPKG